MASGQITVDARSVTRLASLLNTVALDGSKKAQVLHSIGVEVEGQVTERFDTKVDSTGKAWQAISEAHQGFLEKAFPGAQPPLVMEGGLRDSIESQVTGSASVLIGETKIYAATHQWGDKTRNIPARPSLGINEQNARDIENLIGTLLDSWIRHA